MAPFADALVTLEILLLVGAGIAATLSAVLTLRAWVGTTRMLVATERAGSTL
jgi:hypothetical protein